MRVIFIDYSVFMFRAIFATYKNTESQIPPTYTSMAMIIACLKVLKVTSEDKIIFAIDGRNNWRKEIDTEYKGDRKGKRDKFEIDWNYLFSEYDKLKENIAYNTPYKVIEVDRMEADDVIAVGCRYYKDNEVIIVSSDSDFEQLACFENVKVFSPVSKKFKVIKNPYKILAKKIDMERTDNLLSPVLTEEDYNKRKMIVDLTTLPDFVEDACKKALDKSEGYDTIFNYERLKFRSLHKRLIELYNKPKVIKNQTELI